VTDSKPAHMPLKSCHAITSSYITDMHVTQLIIIFSHIGH